MISEPWDRYRAALQDALGRVAAEIEFSHAELVREQLAASEQGRALLSGIVCLSAAEALGADPELALPGATAIVLLANMGDVFLSLESQDGSASLSTAWGMPRALNAGDAFFAAAQDAILTDANEIPVQRRLRALSLLDDAVRSYVAALHAAGDTPRLRDGEHSLLGAALLLAGVYAGVDDGTMSRLHQLGSAWAGLDGADLDTALASDLAGLKASLAGANQRQ